MSDRLKIGILFGAGAERWFGLPSGPDYTFNTLGTRKDELYTALKNYYSGRCISHYAKLRKGRFLFSHKSHSYRRMIELTLHSALEIDEDKETLINYYLNDEIDPADKHKQCCDIINQAYKDYGKKEGKVFLLNEDALKNILKLFYLLSIKYDEEKVSQENKILKSVLYYQLIKGIPENETSYWKDIMQKNCYLYDIYKNFSEEERDFICYFVKKNLQYYGVVEKDFSTIIHPQKTGIVRFWNLVCYFWSAYFSILLPMLKLTSQYKSLSENESSAYGMLLSPGGRGGLKLVEVLNYISTKEYLSEAYQEAKKIEGNNNTEPYYKELKKKEIPIDFALTTNYTPYIEMLELKDNYCFLAGSIFQFELPYEMRTIDIRKTELDQNGQKDFVFPYIMTQAPVKPIIESRQIKEFAKAVNYLESCKLLIILGYSLSDGDNHINSLLREYIIRNHTRMLICKYGVSEDNNTDQNGQNKIGTNNDLIKRDKVWESLAKKTKEDICNKLRISKSYKSYVSGKIDVIINKDSEALAEEIKNYIEGYSTK